jgi:hypothetical protein
VLSHSHCVLTLSSCSQRLFRHFEESDFLWNFGEHCVPTGVNCTIWFRGLPRIRGWIVYHVLVDLSRDWSRRVGVASRHQRVILAWPEVQWPTQFQEAPEGWIAIEANGR